MCLCVCGGGVFGTCKARNGTQNTKKTDVWEVTDLLPIDARINAMFSLSRLSRRPPFSHVPLPVHAALVKPQEFWTRPWCPQPNTAGAVASVKVKAVAPVAAIPGMPTKPTTRLRYVNLPTCWSCFGHVLDNFSQITYLCDTPDGPWDILDLVPVLVGC